MRVRADHLLCRLLLAAALVMLQAGPLLAHGGASHHDESQAVNLPASDGPRNWDELWHTWGWEPASVAGLAISAVFYSVGLARIWRAAGIGHGIKRWEAGCFAAGWVSLFIALVSPLHPWGSVLFSAHMTQHEILMLVSAPLMVLCRPLLAVLHALPDRIARGLAGIANSPAWQRIWTWITAPLVAWFLHAITLWAWHAPRLFNATLTSEWVHAVQHTSFLASALLFWWALIQAKRGVLNYGLGVLFLFTTALHSGFLGALLTFSRTVWYPHYLQTTFHWGLSPVVDQQLGGLIMWVPACAVYIVAGLAMFAGWLRDSERRVQQAERSAAAFSASGASGVPG